MGVFRGKRRGVLGEDLNEVEYGGRNRVKWG
jgi:hypothetical protein